MNVFSKRFVFLTILAFSLSLLAETKKNLVLADRYLVVSILTDIFGPVAKELSREDIFKKPHVFGGPCDMYSQIRVEESDVLAADPDTLCPGGRGAFAARYHGTANMLRVAHTGYACHKITNNETAMSYALSNIYKKSAVSEPDLEKIEVAFNLFNPEKKPSNQVLNALKSVGASSKNNDITKKWSLILYTLCVDPAWQVI